MAIWQYRLILLPEEVLLKKYDILPPSIPMELAESFAWWRDVQPPAGFEDQIDMILPRMESWSPEMRMWGHKGGDDAHVCYVNEGKTAVEEISFRIDARAISSDLVRRICVVAKQLACALMTVDHEILAPDESMVMTAISKSTAKKFVDDPVPTLLNLDRSKIEKRADFLMKDWDKKSEK
jgi:hypothetical protein